MMSKDTKDIPKAYNPKDYEEIIYKKWEESGYFNPDNLPLSKSAETFVISMPPPNVTGVLHLGHALENTIMDIATRYNRMKGQRCLFLPGTDHAAVATQARVERNLMESGQCKNPRQELGREKLLQIIRDYAERCKTAIIKQVKKLGSSCDWSRLAYTFDESRSLAVNTIFKKMYDDGLVYRGYRVVNWSVKGQSTCSDDELVYVEREAKLYTFRYSKNFPITIATTRPETKFGDTAVAVNPQDKRYQRYIGQEFTVDVGAAHPLRIKIIADETVEMNFGTGALGVTPAHSQIDYEIYEKQKAKNDPIDLIAVIDINGCMTAAAGVDYEGLTVEAARAKFVEYLRVNGLIEREENIKQNVGTSDRFKDPIEVIPMDQWFIDVNHNIGGRNKTLKDLMREAVTVGHNGKSREKITIIPERFHDSYLSWIDKLRDWCISRQVWWGHQIPVWYRGSERYAGVIPPDGDGWQQDPDTLDTWFSSGLWTFSTLGWPEETSDLKKYHPNTWMQMGYEILFFWLARMILMTTYALDTIPFYNVYIHGMLRNEQGRKFSKSDRTGVDPLVLIDQYGADALRLSLMMGISPGNDGRFSIGKVESSKNLVNKLWNIVRYVLKLPSSDEPSKIVDLTLSDQWILSRYHQTIKEATRELERWNFSLAEEKLRDFMWNDFADWYLEIAKVEKNKGQILHVILEGILKLWHPFAPFVTEAIWGLYKNPDLTKEKMLMIEKWPKADGSLINNEIEEKFNFVLDTVVAIRNLRSENKIEPAEKTRVIFVGVNNVLADNLEIIKSLSRLETVEFNSAGEKGMLKTVAAGVEIYLAASGANQAKQAEHRAKEIAELDKYIMLLENKLSNKEFVDNAPETVVAGERKKLAEAKDKKMKFEG